jgi:hypothetical protein
MVGSRRQYDSVSCAPNGLLCVGFLAEGQRLLVLLRAVVAP